MIPQSIITELDAIPILEVISGYLKLKKSGANYVACCPFHDEKSSSFTVSPDKNRYKCFGCNVGGGPIKFVQEYEKLDFVAACIKLGAAHNIIVPQKDLSPEENKIQQLNATLYIVNAFAASYFSDNFIDPINKTTLDYALSRWDQDTLAKFDIGFASDSWDDFLINATKNGHKPETLLAAGLIAESKKTPGKFYDVFRNRLMIPLHNSTNHIIGFTGRTMCGHEKKYINTKTTPIYTKGNQLFGMNLAKEGIKNLDMAYLVEGNADVIRMHQIKVSNTVGICSTAFTSEQLATLKKICSTITIIPDSDAAGKLSIDRSAKMIIDAGMNCNVLELPFNKDNKNDADSFFNCLSQFTSYSNAHVADYIVTKAYKYSLLPKTPANKHRAINEISELISKMDSTTRDLYVDQVSRLITPKRAWTDRISELVKENTPEIVKADRQDAIPEHISLVDWQKYGFYEDKNCYYFRTQRGIERGCNFSLVPLFHIESVIDAKRIFRITNEYGITRVIELPINALISIGRFKEAIESLGNFLWEMSETELNKLKRYLYQETKTCLEIKQLGWQKAGFYSWGNGIFNGAFTPVDELGIAAHNNVNYYLPAFSTIWARELQLYMSERHFMHRENNSITLLDYSTRLIKVFGNNASIALCFYFATLFRDIIHRKLNFFPILDLFGPKGAGKTELAVSIMSFFGKMGKGPNVNNTSKAALADHVAQLCNACAHIDEYKNTIELDKIEFLKGCWDGTGRTRMNMDKDKKKETTPVDCGVILSGQEMPTADIALFSRLIYLTFSKATYDDQEKKDFNELKAIEQLGNTHITNQILGLREIFETSYNTSYETVSRELTISLGDHLIEDRIFKNWVVVLAAYHAIMAHLQVGFNFPDLLELSTRQLIIQNSETKKSSEISTFWSIVTYLASDNLIHDGIDYRIEVATEIKTEEMTEARKFAEPTTLLFIQLSRILLLYRKHGKQSGDKILPVDSIKYYIRNDPRFLGTKRTRFMFLDTVSSAQGVWTSKPEWAFVLLYKNLGIDLSTSTDIVDECDPKTPIKEGPGRPSKFNTPPVYVQQTISDEF